MKDSVKYLAPRRKRGAFFSLFLRFFLCLSLLVLLPGCGRSAPSLQRFQSQFMDVFDTVSVLTGYDRDEKSFQEKAEAVHKELRDCHALFDIYDDYEGVVNLKTVNERAGQGPVKVDGRIIELLKFGKEIYRLTGGKVNIAYGAVLSLWHEKREEGIADPEHASLPEEDALLEASKHCRIEDIVIDEDASTVALMDPKMSLDVGGIAKGYAVQRAGERAAELGAKSFLLNIGGNLKAIGQKPDGEKWICPVESPFYIDSGEGERYALTTGLSELSLVTSGDYERYYTVNGERYHHIVDPDTLYPGKLHRSVTILTADSGLADALSTALFLMSREEGEALLRRIREEHFRGLSEGDALEAMWVENDGEKPMTQGFSKYLLPD